MISFIRLSFFLILTFALQANSFISKTAKPLTGADFAKVFSRKSTSPIGRQGTCFVFQKDKDVYCLSSYHVVYNTNDSVYLHRLQFEDGSQSNLEWLAGEWGRGMVLLKLLNAPDRKYAQWGDIKFWPSGDEGERMMAWGFPLNVDVMNVAYGNFFSDMNGFKYPLFVYNETYLYLRNVATEIGFSGGAAVTSAGGYVGMLSHQVLEDNKVITVTISTYDIFLWLEDYFSGRDLVTKTFFYVEPSSFDKDSFILFMKGFSISVYGLPHVIPGFMLNIKSHNRENKVGSNPFIDRLPAYFPKSSPSGMVLAQNDFHVGMYNLIGCSPFRDLITIEDAKFFWSATELARYMVLGHMDYGCTWFVFINTGQLGARVSDATHKLSNIWIQSFGKIPNSEAPMWFAKWNSFFTFVLSWQKNPEERHDWPNVAFLKYSAVEALMNDPVLQKERAYIKQKYPDQLLALEQQLEVQLQLLKLTVVHVPAHYQKP